MLKQRLPRKLSNIKVSQFIRDGPLEKLWGGGRGIVEPQEFTTCFALIALAI